MRQPFILLVLVGLLTVNQFLSGQTEQSNEVEIRVSPEGTMDTSGVPLPPDMPWLFYDDMKQPLWSDHGWTKKATPASCVALSAGVTLKLSYPDPKCRLKTAFDDLKTFLDAGQIPIVPSGFLIETVQDNRLAGESFRLETNESSCKIIAGNIEGIRRGIFYLEDEMIRNEGPFLSLGTQDRTPFIKRRISRCFFSPIKRPGNHTGPLRDELTDDIDYYPDEYLNRMAHEGINGLWLTVSSKDEFERSTGFVDLVATSVTPQAGKDGQRRLEKLRRTVQKCLRYGIRTYIKIIEPAILIPVDDPILKEYPDALGYDRHLCAGSSAGQKYLYESLFAIFKEVPELGGIINISHGELYTSCLSSLSPMESGRIRCPRCSALPPWKIHYETISAMERGVHAANPDAEVISWFYIPQPQNQQADTSAELAPWVYEIAEHTPDRVILQFNFESGVEKDYFGKTLIGGDYWLGIPGPSARFTKFAQAARANRTQVSAKIQTGGSYTMATVPYVPVPSMLYDKFKSMRELGVEYVMLNWIVGAAPGLMNKAAGELSFEPFPKSVDEFLNRIAASYWRSEDRHNVVDAWQHFAQGYSNVPLGNLFQYYGPLNDGIVWPLLLKPEFLPLAPTYQTGMRGTPFRPWPPSGDLIGECSPALLSSAEMITLLNTMNTSWKHGIDILHNIEPSYANRPEQIRDIHLAQAQGLLINSAYNIFRFYDLREKMIRHKEGFTPELLQSMKQIVADELDSTNKMITLWNENTLLGFHADAEGYKFYPEKMKWRIKQLNHLLKTEIPALEKRLARKEYPFPLLLNESVQVLRIDDSYSNRTETGCSLPETLDWAECSHSSIPDKAKPNDTSLLRNENVQVRWAPAYNKNDFFLFLHIKSASNDTPCKPDLIRLNLEMSPLGHTRNIDISLKENEKSFNQYILPLKNNKYFIAVRIPLKNMWDVDDSVIMQRFNLHVFFSPGISLSWQKTSLLPPRLSLPRDNPRNLGWIRFMYKGVTSIF